MPNLAIQYLTDTQGNPNAVVITIAIWKQIFPENLNSVAMFFLFGPLWTAMVSWDRIMV